MRPIVISDPCRDYRYTVTRRHVKRAYLLALSLVCFASAACIGAAWLALSLAQGWMGV